MFSFYIRASQ